MKELNADYILKKLNEEDMLEILTEHYMASSFKGEARGLILGAAGIDLRFIGIWAREPSEEPGGIRTRKRIHRHRLRLDRQYVYRSVGQKRQKNQRCGFNF